MKRIANIALILGCVAGCSDDGPSCKEAITQAAGHFGNRNAPEIATLIGTCEQRSWSTDRRACFADAKSSAALEDCLPALDVKLPLPALTPTPATRKLLADGPSDVRALLFFSEGSGTATVVERYLKDLGRLAVERHDRFKDAALARQYHVFHDGVLVLARGELSESIALDDDLVRAARSPSLRDFDRDLATQVAKVSKPRPKAYVVAGHGEMTDRASLPAALQSVVAERGTSKLRSELADQGFQVANLGSELATEVPVDATVVLIFAPAVALSPAEQAALGRYLDRGGALLYALDPTVEPGLGSLESKLGVRFNHGHLADDKEFYPRLKTAADHSYVLTDSFAPHPTVNGLARGTRGLLLIDSGTLETASAGTAPPKLTFTIRSRESSFIDLDHNFELTPATEKRDRYNVAAAIEGGAFRALVFADTDLFADVIVKGNVGAQGALMMFSDPLFTDSIRWLCRDEGIAAAAVAHDTESAVDTKALFAAELELVQRRLARAYAAALAAGPSDRDEAAKRVRSLQSDEADLRSRAR